MMYSSAIFESAEQDLHTAQLHPLRRICQKLQLSANDHLLEIGTGWGGFAIYAAQNYGCRVTTTTISKEQYELAWQRIQQAGLQDRITLLLDLEDIGLHYATTLRIWRENFFKSINRIRALAYPESFIRMWEFYLCYCEGAFLERAISDVQLVYSKPEFRALPTR